jgi:hypothetical protein
MNNLNIRSRTAPRYLARKLTRVPGRRCVVPIPIRTPPEAGCWDRIKARRACLSPSAPSILRMQPLVLDLTRMRASNSCSSDLDSAPFVTTLDTNRKERSFGGVDRGHPLSLIFTLRPALRRQIVDLQYEHQRQHQHQHQHHPD